MIVLECFEDFHLAYCTDIIKLSKSVSELFFSFFSDLQYLRIDIKFIYQIIFILIIYHDANQKKYMAERLPASSVVISPLYLPFHVIDKITLHIHLVLCIELGGRDLFMVEKSGYVIYGIAASDK